MHEKLPSLKRVKLKNMVMIFVLLDMNILYLLWFLSEKGGGGVHCDKMNKSLALYPGVLSLIPVRWDS